MAQKLDHFQIIDSLNSLGLDVMDKITLIEYVKNHYGFLDENNCIPEGFLLNIHLILLLEQLFCGQFCKFILTTAQKCDHLVILIIVKLFVDFQMSNMTLSPYKPF